ncbi:MAG TPA: tol-pal system protein YbgF [Chlorobaculum sp.]|nr:tol-pal system protein YbgF [Chlorobaculum sp.]
MMKTRPLLFLPFVLLSACASQTDLSYVQGQVSQLKEESQVIKNQSAGSYSEITQYREEVATLKGGVSELRHDHSETLKRLDVEDSLLVKKNIELEKRLARLEKYLDIMDTASKTPENNVIPPPPPPVSPSVGAKSPVRPAAVSPANSKSRLKAPVAASPYPTAAPVKVEPPIAAEVPAPKVASVPAEVSASLVATPHSEVPAPAVSSHPVEVPVPVVASAPTEAQPPITVETPVLAASQTPDLSLKVDAPAPSSASLPDKAVPADRYDVTKARSVEPVSVEKPAPVVAPATTEFTAPAVVQEPVPAKSKLTISEPLAVKPTPVVAPEKVESPKPSTATEPVPAKVKTSYRSWAEKSRSASPASTETPDPAEVPVSSAATAKPEVRVQSAVSTPVAAPTKSEAPVPAWARGKTIAEARAAKKRTQDASPAVNEAPAPVVAAVPVAAPAKSESPVYNGEEALIRDGMAKMEVNDYSGARTSFTSFMEKNPKSPQVGDAQFYIAESYFNEKWYEKAILEYQVVIAKYTKNSKRPASLYKQALSFEKIGDQVNANARFKDVIRNYPLSPEAKLAKKKLQ